VREVAGKIRPKKIIMPSDLTGKSRAKRRSGPVITYWLDELPSSIRGQNIGYEEVGYMSEEAMPKKEEANLRTLAPGDQREVLIELIRQGKTDQEIGESFGLSQWQVRNLRYRLGVKKDRGGNVYIEKPQGNAKDRIKAVDYATAQDDHKGLEVTIRGEFRAENLAQRLGALQALVASGPKDKIYSCRLELVEAED